MTTFRTLSAALLLGALLMMVGTGCDSGTTPPENLLRVDDRGNTQFDMDALRSRLDDLPKENLSAREQESLLFMREEEKLARDVYQQLDAVWGLNPLRNIAASEATHMEAVLLLLDRYELSDPASGQPVGTFTNTDLQALNDSLVAVGETSAGDALRVGAAIEEIDILDLEEALNTVVDNQDITLIYENLLKGSRNHLRAFVRSLEARGITYTPQYLSASAYEDIINNPMETGPMR